MVLNSILLLKLTTLTEAVAWPGLSAWSAIVIPHVLPCDACISAAYAVVRCPSVRLSGVCHVPVLCRSE